MVTIVMLTFQKRKTWFSQVLWLWSVFTECCDSDECRDRYDCCDSDECGDSVAKWHYEHDTHLCAVDISSANDFGFPPVKASPMAFRLAEAWI